MGGVRGGGGAEGWWAGGGREEMSGCSLAGKGIGRPEFTRRDMAFARCCFPRVARLGRHVGACSS